MGAALCGTRLRLSSGGCTLWYSSGVVIWDLIRDFFFCTSRLGLSSEVVVRGCHLRLSSGVVICGLHSVVIPTLILLWTVLGGYSSQTSWKLYSLISSSNGRLRKYGAVLGPWLVRTFVQLPVSKIWPPLFFFP